MAIKNGVLPSAEPSKAQTAQRRASESGLGWHSSFANVALAQTACYEADGELDTRGVAKNLSVCPMYRSLIDDLLDKYGKLAKGEDPLDIINLLSARMFTAGIQLGAMSKRRPSPKVVAL